MALPRGHWDVSYLAIKYPWLRVDQQTLEEFRSPFEWESEVAPHSSVSRDESHEQKQRKLRGRRREETRPGKRGKPKGKKPLKKVNMILRNHEKIFSKQDKSDELVMNNAPSTEEISVPSLDLPIRDKMTVMPLLTAPTPILLPDLEQFDDAVLEAIQQDLYLVKQRQHKRKSRKRKKPTNLLELRFPFITPKALNSMSEEANKVFTKNHSAPTPRTLLDKYSQQIKNLTEEERRLEESVQTRIAQEKSRLPLKFLFERNLMHRSDAQKDGLRVVTEIFAKMQHRMLFNSYSRWKEFLENARHEDRKHEALILAQKRAVALLERVSSDAYVGTLAQGFQRWKTKMHEMIEHERHVAASVIQKAVRAHRSRLNLEALRQAAKALDYSRNQAIQALLRFERYGTTMRWSTLRIGFDFVKQTRAARNLQLFLRRVAVRRQIAHRTMRREGAVRIQAQWRAHVARQEVARRRVERALRLALELKAAIQMERAARGFLARSDALRRRKWLAKAKQTAPRIQRWLRQRRFLANLHVKFRERKKMIEDARARAAAEELARQHWRSVLAVQCTWRRLLARKVYERRLKARRMEQGAVYLQRFWRRRKGLYVLGLRFVERRERIAQCRLQAAIVLQCAYRCFRARCKRTFFATEKANRQRASIVIQRHVRGRIARTHYQQTRNAVLIIQCSIRCALARHQRCRRRQAVHKLQTWIKGVYSCRAARTVLNQLRVEAKRREASVILIQKLVRQREAEQHARLFREALNIVKIEQRRYFGSDIAGVQGGIGWTTHQASSELLTYLTQRFLEDGSCFTIKEMRWLRTQVQAGHERLKREDRAAVYLQRRFRGYATRMAYWVHRMQMDELQRLKEQKAVVIQSGARRWLARRYVRRLREQRRLAELKEAYIRERKQKEEERLWKERYDREQMELSVQRAQEAANQIREARREADLARVKAEAAEYRAKELAAEREIESLLKSSTTENTEANSENEENKDDVKEEKDPWVQYSDEHGNAYYYNENTGESSWDPPPPRVRKAKSTLEHEESTDIQTKDDKVPEEIPVKEVDPLEEILLQGKCIKCQQAQSTKRCLDCVDTKRAFYCTECFKQHLVSLNQENSTTNAKHDFEVVPDAAVVPARCESGMECSVDEDNPQATSNNQESMKNLAAYYCYQCQPCPKANSTTDAVEPEVTNTMENDRALGSFYCEPCFARDHETAKTLRHVDKALRFRRGALLCCDCGHTLAVRECESCGGDKFCEMCFISSHTGSKRRSMKHTWTSLDVLRDLLEKETDTYCVECDVRASSRLCNLCGDGFCDGCFNKTHAKGVKRRHTWLPWSVAAQHGDWIEIKDDKATIYYNVETKESTNKKPNVLLSGEERHRLVLTEREQLQRSRQVELESEVVKLKEQLRELQTQHQPGTRARNPGSNTNNQPPSNKTDTKPPKRGVLSKLFGPKSPPQTLTPEERQRDLANRNQAEQQPISSPAFQQAMVHELTALAVTSPQLSKPK